MESRLASSSSPSILCVIIYLYIYIGGEQLWSHAAGVGVQGALRRSGRTGKKKDAYRTTKKNKFSIDSAYAVYTDREQKKQNSQYKVTLCVHRQGALHRCGSAGKIQDIKTKVISNNKKTLFSMKSHFLCAQTGSPTQTWERRQNTRH